MTKETEKSTAADELLSYLHDNPPDGWVIVHTRATDSLMFGPFLSVAQAMDFAKENDIGCNLRPMYLTVDWNRRA